MPHMTSMNPLARHGMGRTLHHTNHRGHRSRQPPTGAFDQLTGFSSGQRRILDVQRDPHGTGLGKPELLKGPLSGWSSRRINAEHRLIYRVRGGDLEIAACHGHYLDK